MSGNDNIMMSRLRVNKNFVIFIHLDFAGSLLTINKLPSLWHTSVRKDVTAF